MGWATPPDALVARFARLLPADPRVERRQMFGCPCAFVGGQMFTGLFRDQLFIRLPAAARTAMLSGGALPFEPQPGRVMREYVCVPVRDRRARRWVAEALAYVADLPPKAPRRRPRTAARRGAMRP